MENLRRVTILVFDGDCDLPNFGPLIRHSTCDLFLDECLDCALPSYNDTNLRCREASCCKAHRYSVEPVNLAAEFLLYGLLERVRPTSEDSIDPPECLLGVLKPAVTNISDEGLSRRGTSDIRT